MWSGLPAGWPVPGRCRLSVRSVWLSYERGKDIAGYDHRNRAGSPVGLVQPDADGELMRVVAFDQIDLAGQGAKIALSKCGGWQRTGIDHPAFHP